MPLQATSGAASYDAFGGGVPVVPKYIEDYFSTYLVTGDGTAPAVNNGIDLSTKGGLVWTKKRSAAGSHSLFDTARGANLRLISNDTAAQDSVNLSFTTTGFSNYTFDSGVTYTSWSWAKAPKFFDVVTYSGSSSTQNIAHNLGSVPGCIIVKRTSGVEDWFVYHTSLGNTKYLKLNTDGAEASGFAAWNNTSPTSTQFTVLGGRTEVNAAGSTYVAYLFAHNAGGFGLTGTDNVISCGSVNTPSSGTATVSLGYEPQWVLLKRSDAGNQDWFITDNMRGFSQTSQADLSPNTSGAESVTATPGLLLTSTGFTINAASYGGSRTFIYIAIRRGPMKVPTSGTSVFAPVLNTGTGANTNISSGSFAPDMLWNKTTDHAYGTEVWDKLRGVRAVGLTTSNTGAEGLSPAGYDLVSFNNTGVTEGSNSGSVMNISTWLYVNYMFGRAPSVFDIVCYTGTGVAGQTFNHNLTVVPELMIVKCRSSATPGTRAAHWEVYSATAGAANFGVLNLNINWETFNGIWNSTAPTSSVFTVGSWGAVNASGETYVAYLFASAPNVSKVGSYTGTEALQTINCGFTSGARFVLIRRYGTSSGDGDWYVWDSARGITSGNDPYLLLNSTAAEVTGTNYVDTDSTGFKVTAAAPAGLNASGGTYIFLAIA